VAFGPLEYFMKLKIGDLIKAYHSGIHEVTVEPGYAKTVGYKQVYTNEGKPFRGKNYVCHVDYCRKIDPEWIEGEVAIHKLVIKQLYDLINHV